MGAVVVCLNLVLLREGPEGLNFFNFKV